MNKWWIYKFVGKRWIMTKKNSSKREVSYQWRLLPWRLLSKVSLHARFSSFVNESKSTPLFVTYSRNSWSDMGVSFTANWAVHFAQYSLPPYVTSENGPPNLQCWKVANLGVLQPWFNLFLKLFSNNNYQDLIILVYINLNILSL